MLGRCVHQVVDALRSQLEALPVLYSFFQAGKGVAAQGVTLGIGHDDEVAVVGVAPFVARVALGAAGDDDVGRILGIGAHLDGAAAVDVAESEAPYGCRVVVAYALLLGVEAHALADDGGLGARGAPYGVGHLEAYREDAVRRELGRSRSECVLLVESVAAGRPLDVRGDVAAHVEALHGERLLLVLVLMRL